jgi:replication factor C subunit 1
LKESQEDDRNAVAIELMDDYGLDRDDVFENLDEFKMDKGEKLADVLDSKAKAAFTREYNKGKHTSQALVQEQGAPTKTKRKGTTASTDPDDPDAIDDDFAEEEDGEEDEDMEKLRAAFAKKGRKAAAAKSKSTSKATGRGKKK